MTGELHPPRAADSTPTRKIHPPLQRLGTRIRILRKEQGLSREALADMARIGRSYMSGIERGVRNCSALHLIRIAIDVNYLSRSANRNLGGN